MRFWTILFQVLTKVALLEENHGFKQNIKNRLRLHIHGGGEP